MNSMLDIKVLGEDVLRKKAEPVSEITPDLLELAQQMLDTMYEAPGVGLAAPQVGKSIRLVVVDPDYREEDEYGERKHNPIILFNPEITPADDAEPEEDEEGCLSVPDIYASVTRPDKIHLKYLNTDGETVEMQNVDGFLPRVVQHECDHLDGVLFVDKISAAERALNASKLKKLARRKSAKATR